MPTRLGGAGMLSSSLYSDFSRYCGVAIIVGGSTVTVGCHFGAVGAAAIATGGIGSFVLAGYTTRVMARSPCDAASLPAQALACRCRTRIAASRAPVISAPARHD